MKSKTKVAKVLKIKLFLVSTVSGFIGTAGCRVESGRSLNNHEKTNNIEDNNSHHSAHMKEWFHWETSPLLLFRDTVDTGLPFCPRCSSFRRDYHD